MAITIGNSTNVTASNSLTATLVAPAGISDNDILVTMVGNDSYSTFTPPGAGWTQWASSVAGTSRACALWWKRASSESGDYIWTTAGASYWRATMTVVKGCKASGDPANVGVSNTPYVISDANIQAAALTPTVPVCLLWAGLAWHATDWTITVPTGFTIQGSQANNYWGVHIATKLNQAEGATGEISGTCNGGTTIIKHAFMVALEPVPEVTLTAVQHGAHIDIGWS